MTPVRKVNPARPPDEDIARAVSVGLDIQAEYASLPAFLSRWVELKADAARAVRLAEWELETVEARVRIELRGTNDVAVARQAAKRLTDAGLEALVTSDDDVQEAHFKLIDAQERKDRAGGMVDVLMVKKDMLVGLGADMRLDRERGPMIRDRGR